MGYLADGLCKAVDLLTGGDAETFSAILTTVSISSLSISISLITGIPLGFLLGYNTFPGKKQVRTMVDTLLSLPTVVIGLIVYAFITHKGPLGGFALLYTVPGIAAAQVILVLPIVISLTATAIEGLDSSIIQNITALGADKKQAAMTCIIEARYGIFTAAVTAFGRAVSEVGISMMIGGNIKWHTRTITTAIALETGKGQFAMGIALGLVLITLALLVNILVAILKKRDT